MTPAARAYESVWPQIRRHFLIQRYPPGLRDDLLQAARIGCWKAVRDYRPGRGASLATFAKRKARGEQLHFLRDCSAIVRIPYSAFGSVEPLKRAPLSEAEGLAVPDALPECALSDTLRRARAVLSEKAWSAFLLMADGYTPSDVGRMEGVHPATVHQRVRAARRLLAERGIGDDL
jgi:RNA polymerase sigma factor (sigma-70 family)